MITPHPTPIRPDSPRALSNAVGKAARTATLLGLSVLPCLVGSAVEAERPPNVIFVLADDLGYGDLPAFGNPYLDTPVLNRLTAEGVRLTAHYAPSPLCAPSRAGFLTGRYNHRTGGIDVSSNRGIDRIALDEKTFGDYFRHAGYATALIGKWHSGLYHRDYLPHNRGFDLFYGFANGEMDYWRWHLQRNDAVESHDGRYLTDALTDETITFIRSNEERPFAVFLAHLAPHLPLQAPEELVEKYRERLCGRYDDAVAVIYAMIEAMDTGLGRIVAELEERGLKDNTIFVFTSDNGALLGRTRDGTQSLSRYTGPLSGGKGQVFEQGIRVPAIVSWPAGLAAGTTVGTPVHGCDWLPTLHALTGAPPPPDAKPMDGQNILPLLQGGPVPELKERFFPFQKNRYTPVAHSGAALRRGEWKIHWPPIREANRKDAVRDNISFHRGAVHPHWEMPLDPWLPDFEGVRPHRPRLFNLVEDPGERHDRAEEFPEIVATLAALYEGWFSEVKNEWRAAWDRIVAHDEAAWQDREAPDPAALFADFWPWDAVDADPATDDPLEVFIGFWNFRERSPP